MVYSLTLFSVLQAVIVTIPILLVVAFVTVAERKTLASMQRRLGPNIVGYYGLLQAFADALKLLLKEYVSPTQANIALFFAGPIITLVFSLLAYLVIPFAPGLTLDDFNLGVLYILVMSSLGTYGILLAGWSANSKYAFLGSLRSTAQLISYELILTSAILVIVLLTSSLNMTTTIETQRSIWFILPLFPVFYIFFIGSVAETNRAPFDLAEAESELVSGFMTEHAAVIFVFFFLAEYASILLICFFIATLFLGGYLLDFNLFNTVVEYLNITSLVYNVNEEYLKVNLFENLYYSISVGIKTMFLVFVFIWVRASFPRIRFDQLMFYCWTVLLPLIFAIVVFIPCIIYGSDIVSTNIIFS